MIGYRFAIDIRNLGPGLAKDVVIEAWIADISGVVEGLNAVEKIEEAKGQVDLGEPELFVRIGGMASGDRLTAYLNPTTRERPLPWPEHRPVLIYMARYADVFGNKFPRQTGSELKPGSIILPIDWKEIGIRTIV